MQSLAAAAPARIASGAASRLPFLDWTRGVAVLVMIQCHVFNSFTHMSLREGGPYVLSQFVGGMAAPLFLFLAGVTFAFGMDRQDRRATAGGEKLLAALRRSGYIFVLAYLFRLSNWLFSLPHPPWQTMLRVDILNCMAFAMLLLSPLALCPGALRARAAAVAGAAIAAAAPVMNSLDWSAVPDAVRNYFLPSHLAFAFFPCGAYVGFGLAAGAILRRLAAERVERTMQWSVLVGLAMIAGGQYFSNLPYSIYPQSNFWVDSPGLVTIRVGLMLALLSAAYVWTQFAVGAGWSWVQSLGKTSLLVYWVHVVLVYGKFFEPWKKALSVAEASAVTVAVMVSMLGLSVLRLRWKGKIRLPAWRRAAI